MIGLMIDFFKGSSIKYIAIGLLVISAVFNIKLSHRVVELSTEVQVTTKQLKDKTDLATSLEKQLAVINEQITEQNTQLLDKQQKIQKFSEEITNLTREFDKSNSEKWNKSRFTGKCEKDINILKKNALDIKRRIESKRK